ncbi:hypothetical protein M8C21_008718, partial [Ambrosia artemisiifolia]
LSIMQQYPNKMDRISKLPLGIIETILCLLPIHEAVRTSILSKEWRYHWATIPKLVFIDDKHQVHKGPIHEFTMYMNSEIEPTGVSEDPTIVDLFQCLPVIEYLSLWFYIILHFSPTKLPKMLPTTLIHLKYLCVECVSINHKYGFPFLFLLIRSSPNLEKLKLDVFCIDRHDEDEIASFTLKDYSDIIMLEHLNELEILDFNNVEIELDFVKLIMAKSPVLKKVKIFLYYKPDEDEELRISKILIGSPCASPVVKVIVDMILDFEKEDICNLNLLHALLYTELLQYL